MLNTIPSRQAVDSITPNHFYVEIKIESYDVENLDQAIFAIGFLDTEPSSTVQHQEANRDSKSD